MIEVCRASAGSGKTHKLTGEYIRLLFRDPEEGYKHILAVTFTNKATDEMKQRILRELHLLSLRAEDSPYLAEIREETGLSPERIGVLASGILMSVLHDYSSFRVSTIDAFFQSIMRSFARELGRFASYNVELDTVSILEAAVDKMFSDLEEPGNAGLLEWLIAFSLDQIDAGESWDIRSHIKRLAQEIFSEEYKIVSGEEEPDRTEIGALKERMDLLQRNEERKLQQIGCRAVALMEQYGLAAEDFRGKSRSPFVLFRNIQNIRNMRAGDIQKGLDKLLQLPGNPEAWYNAKDKSCKKEAILEAYGAGLNECAEELVRWRGERYPLYVAAGLIRQNLNILGIFRDVGERVAEYCRERNAMLLPETAGLLNRLIDGNDAPFIYEKIGAQIAHYMLDEFQDTSALQWRNFYPLLKDSVSQQSDNLVVGDVKQSIYRWRGSDWGILNRELAETFEPYELSFRSLDTNWRSRFRIVDFNNRAFRYLSEAAQQALDGTSEGTITGIYAGFEQRLPAGKEGEGGRVELNFVEKEADPQERPYEEIAAELLPEKIRELLGRGYRPGDIAVLVARKSEGRLAAQSLSAAGFELISDDSLFLTASRAVNSVINLLRRLDHPDSRSAEAAGRLSGTEKLTPEQAERLSGLSLFEMCEEIIAACLKPEEREEIAYLQKLLDLVLDYTVNEGTNLSGFLKWWENSREKHTISAPERTDAIRIMTIHKAKGLGFPVAVVPFLKARLCESHTARKPKRIWCVTDHPEIGYRGALFLNFTSELDRSLFSQEYRREKLYSYVDALNVVYVAFTRPKEELVVFAPAGREGKNGRSLQSVSDLLYWYCNDELPECECGAEDREAGPDYGGERVGKKLVRKFVSGEAGRAGRSAGEEPVIERPVRSLFSGTASSGGRGIDRIRETLRTEWSGEEGHSSVRARGIAYHYIFSLLRTERDVPEAVMRARNEGIPVPEGAETWIRSRLASVKDRGWFEDGYGILNECSIVDPDGSVFRPDRVLVRGREAAVVDYKFGEYGEGPERDGRYLRQVRRYMQLLLDMGYEEVAGYLWYVREEKVVSVSLL